MPDNHTNYMTTSVTQRSLWSLNDVSGSFPGRTNHSNQSTKLVQLLDHRIWVEAKTQFSYVVFPYFLDICIKQYRDWLLIISIMPL